MDIDGINNRMYELGYSNSYKYKVKEFLEEHPSRYTGFNRSYNISKLIIHLVGNNRNDSIYMEFGKVENLIKVEVYRKNRLYQTHIFEDLTELKNRSRLRSWWDFDPIVIPECVLLGNFGI